MTKQTLPSSLLYWLNFLLYLLESALLVKRIKLLVSAMIWDLLRILSRSSFLASFGT